MEGIRKAATESSQQKIVIEDTQAYPSAKEEDHYHLNCFLKDTCSGLGVTTATLWWPCELIAEASYYGFSLWKPKQFVGGWANNENENQLSRNHAKVNLHNGLVLKDIQYSEILEIQKPERLTDYIQTTPSNI